jgi:hypothetical protein
VSLQAHTLYRLENITIIKYIFTFVPFAVYVLPAVTDYQLADDDNGQFDWLSVYIINTSYGMESHTVPGITPIL